MTDESYTPEEAALAAEIDALLADPSLWADPSADLEDRVVAAIQAEAASDLGTDLGSEVGPPSATRSYRAAPSRRRRWLSAAGAAAVGAAAAAAVFGLVATGSKDDSGGEAIAMSGTDLAPGVKGTAEFTVVASGVRIDLKVPGLPRRDGGEFYQVWLKRCDGSELVPAGSFHELAEAIAWAGVSPADFPLLTVTREVVAPPKDAAQGSSGEVVVSGAIGECPG